MDEIKALDSFEQKSPLLARIRIKDISPVFTHVQNRRLLLLISVGKNYHEGEATQALTDVIKNIILAQLIIVKKSNKYRHLECDDIIMHCSQDWIISVVIADTLQAYNYYEDDSIEDHERKKKYLEK